MAKKAFLMILDGWGLGKDPGRSAIEQGSTPHFDTLMRTAPNAELITYGMDVGLPEGQMGNSEVGHLNIGAGRVVYQELARINKAISDKTFADNETFNVLIKKAKETGKKVHLMGLLSDGGVHSHISHLKEMVTLLDQQGIEGYVHAFLDGRDTDPRSGKGFVEDLLNHMEGKSFDLSSLIGRYFAMDRDKRWERIKKAYDLLTRGMGQATSDPLGHLQKSYDEDVTDEFVEPTAVVDSDGQHHGTISEGDIVFFVNFRTDRPRQLTEVLTQADKPEYDMRKMRLDFFTMTSYDETFNGIKVLFHKEKIKMTLGEFLSAQGLSQVRIAETEKYPHVTFFFNGGEEEPMKGEERILVPSPKVATYDLKPEMSALEITTNIIAKMQTDKPDFVCLNFANADMVGHTGDFEAAKAAAACVDQCMKEIIDCGQQHDYQFVIIADHGNSDYMINDDGSPHTAHTTNPVPVIVISDRPVEVKYGKLADVAPTILSLMELEQPQEMTGISLVN